jgi:ankyrin repeat protein
MNFLEPFPEIELDTLISPLIVASFLGRYDVVRLLLENPSIDIDFSSEDTGQTPLTSACMTGNYEIVKMLVIFLYNLIKIFYLIRLDILCYLDKFSYHSYI